MHYYCHSEQRRTALKDHPVLNGIDFLEVIDDKNDAYEDRQTTLAVHFVNSILPGSLQAANIIIEGGERIKNIRVISISYGPGSPPDSPVSSPPTGAGKIVLVKVSTAGDYSTYTLRLVADDKHGGPPAGYDPLLSSVDFSFKVLCDNDFDCKPSCDCDDEVEATPDINYLAKDYASFRQLMLDRMALLVPQWKERNPADLGIVLVELLAYTADYLSYRQDAIATEAYMGTARRRSSIRRHARLVDYFMHDGSNARTWLHVEVAPGVHNLPLTKTYGKEPTKVLTKRSKYPSLVRPDQKLFESLINKVKDPAGGITNQIFDFVLPADLQIFELMHDERLDEQHNTMNFYTWMEEDYCLPKGTTSASLEGHFPGLTKGQVLVFAEVAGPNTGKESDANPLNRHAVKLTEVELIEDPLGTPLPVKVTSIKWHNMDALPFPLCVSSTDEEGKTNKISVAYGNNILVDHGFTVQERLPAVPATNDGSRTGLSIIQSSACGCEKADADPVPARYRPFLKQSPLTQSVIYHENALPVSAKASLSWTASALSPAITLNRPDGTTEWTPKRDLLGSKHNDEHFVVEIESEGTAFLRFGNDQEGKRPEAETTFIAAYRVGNGLKGNIGPESLKHLVSADPGITPDKIKEVWNPLPAIGGMEAETMQTVKMRAPIAFRRQERAVTLADYEEVSKRVIPGVQRTAASLRWTGSWRTVFLSVDRVGGETIDEEFKNRLRNDIEKYRMAGQDLEVTLPQFVNLEIEMTVCVKPEYFKSEVKKALLQVFSNKISAKGKPGIFHPDNFSFGQPVYLSPVYAAAQQTEGVQSVRITVFQRQGMDDDKPLRDGKLLLNRFEIARLDNDPSFPERGVFKLDMQGGK
ncbi:MAG: putative baseplate assembly protein [Chitinophagaceae bacterium]